MSATNLHKVQNISVIFRTSEQSLLSFALNSFKVSENRQCISLKNKRVIICCNKEIQTMLVFFYFKDDWDIDELFYTVGLEVCVTELSRPCTL